MVPPSEPMGVPQIPASSNVWNGGLMAGQATDVMGMTTMPTGFVFRGVRYFVSNNLPKASVSLTYSNAADAALNGAAVRNGELGIFFGPEAIAVGLGGAGPQIRLNSNDDFQRFVIAIWHLFGSWELSDERFVTVARSFTN